MGQKVNPIGLRLGINRGWDSVWYAKKKDFGNYLIEDFKIREYIKKNVINSFCYYVQLFLFLLLKDTVSYIYSYSQTFCVVQQL